MPDIELRQLLPLALSINTIVLMWLVGNNRVLGWVLGLAGQAGWFAFVVLFDAYGLLPLAVALTVVYARNLWRWTGRPRIVCVRCGATSPDDPCTMDGLGRPAHLWGNDQERAAVVAQQDTRGDYIGEGGRVDR